MERQYGGKRFLVIDDDPKKCIFAAELFGTNAKILKVIPRYDSVENFKRSLGKAKRLHKDLTNFLDAEYITGTEPEIEKILREEKYRAMFLDYKLDIGIDGDDVVERLRQGGYGPLSKNTPIISTSIQSDAIKLAENWFCTNLNLDSVESYREDAKKFLDKYK